MKFWMKIHKFKDEKIVAICDEALLDKKLMFDDIEIIINDKFYKGELVDGERVKKEINDATIINAFGENSISLLKETGFISENNILYVEGVPHAQFAKIK